MEPRAGDPTSSGASATGAALAACSAGAVLEGVAGDPESNKHTAPLDSCSASSSPLHPSSPSALVFSPMATQQFDGGVPFAVAASAQKLQLLELPADVAALLDAPNPPQCAPSSRPASWIAF